jgi:hypothetical protein
MVVWTGCTIKGNFGEQPFFYQPQVEQKQHKLESTEVLRRIHRYDDDVFELAVVHQRYVHKSRQRQSNNRN